MLEKKMAIVDRKITSFELRQSTGSRLQSSKLVESTSIVKKGERRHERRYMLNTDYLNALNRNALSEDASAASRSKRRVQKPAKADRGKGAGLETEWDRFECKHGMMSRSPIVTSQGYHLYMHLVIEDREERDVFTVGDHVMVCLSDGGERPAQVTAFLYDPEDDLQGVELRWYYSEHDLLDLGKIIDKSKLPEALFTFEEEFLESDKCEVLEASVIKRMIRIWNVKRDYLRWARDSLGIYSGPRECGPGKTSGEDADLPGRRYHDERLADYIKDFNEDLPSYSVEVSDNFLAMYLVLTDTGTIVPISERRNVSHLLSRCSSYYGYYVNHLALRLSVASGLPASGAGETGREVQNALDLHWSKRPRKILPRREKEHEEIMQVLKTSILNEGGGVLFVAGLPGTGKTATVLNALEMLETEMNLSNKNESKISVCYINALHLSSPDHFYRTFLQKLNGANTWAPNKEACYSSLDRYLKTRASPVTILVIDEIDWLQKNGGAYVSLEAGGGSGGSSSSSNSSLLYTLIDWPFQRNSRLIIVAIANTMDLPERLIPRCTSRCGYARVNFTPFSVEDMISILNDRVRYFSADDSEISARSGEGRRTSPRTRGRSRGGDSESVFCSKAVEFCARRIAQQSSDVRRALQVLHRAWEISKQDLEARPAAKRGRKLQVQIAHVQAACREVLLNNVSLSLVGTLPLVYKVFLASVILELEFRHKHRTETERRAVSASDEAESCRSHDEDGRSSSCTDGSAYENSVSLLKVEKRMLTVLSLAGLHQYAESMDSGYTKTMVRRLVSSRVIQTFKGGAPTAPTSPSSTRLERDEEEASYHETLNLFGSDIWISLLVDALALRGFLVKNLPVKIKGLE